MILLIIKSGLKNWYDIGYDGSKIKFNSSTEVYNHFINEKINTGNKNIYSYSNISYIILGVLIETITNLNYFDFINENILIPLNMKNTNLDDTNITLYNFNYEKNKMSKLNEYQKNERSLASSAGSLKSNVSDLIKLSNFVNLLNNNTKKILKELYIFKNYHISHTGGILGSKTKLNIEYDNNFNFISIYIELKTAI